MIKEHLIPSTHFLYVSNFSVVHHQPLFVDAQWAINSAFNTSPNFIKVECHKTIKGHLSKYKKKPFWNVPLSSQLVVYYTLESPCVLLPKLQKETPCCTFEGKKMALIIDVYYGVVVAHLLHERRIVWCGQPTWHHHDDHLRRSLCVPLSAKKLYFQLQEKIFYKYVVGKWHHFSLLSWPLMWNNESCMGQEKESFAVLCSSQQEL